MNLDNKFSVVALGLSLSSLIVAMIFIVSMPATDTPSHSSMIGLCCMIAVAGAIVGVGWAILSIAKSFEEFVENGININIESEDEEEKKEESNE
jgi:hypothetical protein